MKSYERSMVQQEFKDFLCKKELFYSYSVYGKEISVKIHNYLI